MRRLRDYLPVAVFVASISAHAAAAPPDPLAEARKLYEEGSKKYDFGDYDEAIEAFKRAYALSGAAGLLFNIAQAYRLKGPASCEDALAHYKMYLDNAPRAPNRAETEERIGQMRECAREARTTTTPEPSPAAPPPAPAPMPTETRHEVQRTMGWIVLGLGAAGVAIGTVSGAIGLGKQGELDGQCPQRACPATLRSDLDAYDRLRAVSTIGFVVGAIGVSAGITLLLTAPKADRSAQAWISADGAGIRGRF